jgi:hypothetical protein
MGFRRLAFLLSVTFVVSLAACGDNKRPVFDDAGTMDMGEMVDATDAPPDAGCPVGQTLCGTSCVDVKTDNDHCGDCATDCGTGTCQTNNGMTKCCPTGQTNCNGTCVDTTLDADNCGTCGTDCGGTNICSTNGTSSICCPSDQINCGGQCVDPLSNAANCGGCTADGDGVACTGATDTCCAGSCTNVDVSTTNCGMCGTACTAGTPACTPPVLGSGTTDSKCCPAGETNCGGTCTSLVASDANCGGCGIACTGLNHCQTPDTGSTTTTVACCPDSQNNCNGTCSDPLTDNNNCGTCGNQCGGSDTCQSGVCCGPNEINCGGVCVDPDTNPGHCGGCPGATCSGGTPSCSDGSCTGVCDVSEVSCVVGAGPATACVTITTDPNNCGACGTKCGPTEVCNNGTCGPVAGCTGGKINCNGECVDPTTDENHCGPAGTCPSTVCDPTDTCQGGLCCDSGQTNLGGKCCDSGTILCNVGGVLTCSDPTDDSTCGTCSNNCGTGSCTNNAMGGLMCCPAGTERCGATCVPLNTTSNCGACGAACVGGDTCQAPNPATGTVQCCDPTTELNCGSTCIDKFSDPNNCGGCGIPCGANLCSNGKCCPSGQTGFVFGANSICCPGNQISCDGLTCIDLNANTTCGTGCGMTENCLLNGELCVNQDCSINCGSLTTCGTSCADLQTDENHCGTCTTTCTVAGSQCTNGVCGCPSGTTTCAGACVDTTSNNTHCGGCAGAPGSDTCDTIIGETCQSGHCCAAGTTWCPTANGGAGACIDPKTDNANCGGCSTTANPTACSGNETCQAGSCECSFGQSQVPTAVGNCTPGVCYTQSIDPQHCGLECKICGPGEVCVAGGCRPTCPAPLTECNAAVGDPFQFPHCTNTSTDNLNCGGCGTKCPSGQGCSNGGCVPLVPTNGSTRPAACVGGGPPISVPTGGGQQTCTGNLGSVSFLFGLCSRTNIGPISREIFTDAFNSKLGTYKTSCTISDDCAAKRCVDTGVVCTGTGQGTCGVGDVCAAGVKCVNPTNTANGGKCVGGGIGVNGRNKLGIYLDPLVSNSALTSVGGDFWTFGTVGLAVKGNTVVYVDHINGPAADANTSPLAQNGPIDLASKDVKIWGNSEVKGGWTSNQNGAYAVAGILKTASACTGTPARPIPQVTSSNPIQCLSPFTNRDEPCGKFDGTDGSLIPVAQTIVPYFRDPLKNNNADINLKYNALDNASGHLDLPCGIYFLNTINTNGSTTIAVRGRVALIVGGSVRLAQPIFFDLDAGSSLDIFVGGVLDVSQSATLGSPAYPARTRMYMGSGSCQGGGVTCDDPTDCCSGVCTACPVDATGKPTAACAGMGLCGGSGSGLDKAISLSQGGNFNGLLWAGYGTFTHQSPLEMYGSLYAGFFDASGVTTIHYDKGAAELGEECPPIPPGSACESARDCPNLACVGNSCVACTADAQCVPPKRCVSGTCTSN